MSKKLIKREGPKWVEAGIVTSEQVEKISLLYDDRRHAVSLLPLLGAILLGLGVLSFIAANWASIPPLARLLLIISLMTGAYVAGEAMMRKDQPKTGVALISVGWVCFGGGIILIGQMYHLMIYSALLFVVWAAAGTALAWLYRSRYLFLLAFAAAIAAQIYSASEFGSFSYSAFALLAALGAIAWNRAQAWMLWLVSLGAAFEAFLWVQAMDIRFLWLLVPMALMYAAADWIGEPKRRTPIQGGALAGAFVLAVWMVMFGDNEWIYQRTEILPALPMFAAAMALPLVLTITGKLKQRKLQTGIEWLLFIPFAYIPNGFDMLYMLALFVFSLHVLWKGYEEEARSTINAGTVLFLLSTLIAYAKLTWDFMDKSLFFIVGGALLLLLGWFLNRKRNRFLDERKGGDSL